MEEEEKEKNRRTSVSLPPLLEAQRRYNRNSQSWQLPLPELAIFYH
jgi:hypothetical protein